MAAAQQQVSTGRRLNGAGDDPARARSRRSSSAPGSARSTPTRDRVDAGRRRVSPSADADARRRSATSWPRSSWPASARGARSADRPLARRLPPRRCAACATRCSSDINTQFQRRRVCSPARSRTRPPTRSVGGAWTYQGNADTAQVEVEHGRLVSVTFDGQAIAQGSDADRRLHRARRSGHRDQRRRRRGDRRPRSRASSARSIARCARRAGSAPTSAASTMPRCGCGAARRPPKRAARKLEDANMAEAITRLTEAQTAYRAAPGVRQHGRAHVSAGLPAMSAEPATRRRRVSRRAARLRGLPAVRARLGPAVEPFTIVQGLGPTRPSFAAIDPLRVVGGYRADCERGRSERACRPDATTPLLWLALVAAPASRRADRQSARAARHQSGDDARHSAHCRPTAPTGSTIRCGRPDVLVFTRKLDQAIVIGDGIEVTVLRIGRDAVRLGVTAAAARARAPRARSTKQFDAPTRPPPPMPATLAALCHAAARRRAGRLVAMIGHLPGLAECARGRGGAAARGAKPHAWRARTRLGRRPRAGASSNRRVPRARCPASSRATTRGRIVGWTWFLVHDRLPAGRGARRATANRRARRWSTRSWPHPRRATADGAGVLGPRHAARPGRRAGGHGLDVAHYAYQVAPLAGRRAAARPSAGRGGPSDLDRGRRRCCARAYADAGGVRAFAPHGTGRSSGASTCCGSVRDRRLRRRSARGEPSSSTAATADRGRHRHLADRSRRRARVADRSSTRRQQGRASAAGSMRAAMTARRRAGRAADDAAGRRRQPAARARSMPDWGSGSRDVRRRVVGSAAPVDQRGARDRRRQHAPVGRERRLAAFEAGHGAAPREFGIGQRGQRLLVRRRGSR